MIITAPVTDYIPASILTTLNDKVIRGAAIPERIAEIDWRGVHINNSTRNANGVQVVAGVGFTSRLIIFLCVDNNGGNINYSWGFTDGTEDMCITLTNDGANSNLENALCMAITRDGGNMILATCTAIGADGYSLTWALTGACAADFIYICVP